ncbi:MAG: PIN domain-containing protein [Deltaproteobacteria bacterium]|nr:PIN domain-containing protein [Deltaproteobacteria bacterium]
MGQASASKALKSLELISETKRGWVTSFSLHAIEAIIGSTAKVNVLSDFLEFVSGHPFLDRYSTSTDEEKKICRICSELKLDFDDSLQYYVAKTNHLTLVTFDKHFLKAKGIKVLFPA